MKRREAIASLVAAVGAASGVEALPAQPGELGIDGLLRELVGVSPLPGEARAARQFLLSLRSRSRSDPREQPALSFDPEVDFEP